MQITAALVKELRERTGAGMMECKKALVETEGDIDKAIENMRKSGQAKADKKAGRVAAEGLIAIATNDAGTAAAMVEVNCETDFVAKEDEFKEFVTALAQRALTERSTEAAALSALSLDAAGGITVEERRRDLVAKIGENMSVRRAVYLEAPDGGLVGGYLHGGRIGVVVTLNRGTPEVAKDIAMHVAASDPVPVCIAEDDVPPEILEKEKEIFTAQAVASGKPPEIAEKMTTGRVKKFLKEITLLGQPFVKDPDLSVEKYLANANAGVAAFERFAVGEGIEKKAENFAEEVMATVRETK